MARLANVNNVFTTTGGFNFAASEVLKAAGWTTVKSSDGTTYNAGGEQITHNGTGAGGFGNTNAYRVQQDPGGRRQLCWQGGTNALNTGSHARIKVSELAGFSGGSPGAARVPSATDEQVLLGAGTDATPTYGTLWTPSISGARLHAVAESTSIGNVYGFNFFCTNIAAATQSNGVFFCEPMAPGSYRAGDVSPCVWFCSTTYANANLMCWFAYGLGGQAWSTVASASAGVYGGTLGVNLVDGADDNGYPQYSAAVSGSTRVKGVGSRVAAKGPARTYPATANTATDAKVYLGSYCWPYPNNTLPSVS